MPYQHWGLSDATSTLSNIRHKDFRSDFVQEKEKEKEVYFHSDRGNLYVELQHKQL